MMKWSEEAKRALKEVPFFARNRVKKRVEEEAAREGERVVTIERVNACRRKFLDGQEMEKEMLGYRIETCFGKFGCPNRAIKGDNLTATLEQLMQGYDLKSFLKKVVSGPLKLHHEFSLSLSDCPNGCSRPHIADVGLIGARLPSVTEEPCSGCGACVEACEEKAINLHTATEGRATAVGPTIDYGKCLACGKCINACPTGTITEKTTGFRILLGGKLGRHPRLGTEIGGLFDEEKTRAIVKGIVEYYLANCEKGERLGEIIERKGMGELEENLKKILS